jgi:hypothetical protein
VAVGLKACQFCSAQVRNEASHPLSQI